MHDWYRMALAVISEGFCPDHKIPLDPQPPGGFCAACGQGRGIWWSVYHGDTVIADTVID